MSQPPRPRNRAAVIAALVLLAVLAAAGLAWRAARTEAAEQRRADEGAAALERLFAEADAARRAGAPVAPADLLRRGREQVDATPDASPRLRTELLAALGAQLARIDRFADAEAVLTQAVELGRAELGDEQAATDAARVQRGHLWRAIGRQKEARVELDALLPRLRERSDDRPRDLVAALELLALLHGDAGQPAPAATAAREALALADARLRDAPALSVAPATLLARALHEQKQAAAALDAARDALRRADQAHPGDAPHPRRIEARALLGRTLAEAGQLERGIAEMGAALEATRRLHGRDSLEAAVAAQSLVAYQVDRGELRAANLGADEALRVMLRVSLRKSYNVGAAFDARGLARLAARRDADARDNLVIATQTLGVMIGHEHPATRLAKAHLTQALLAVEGSALAAEAVRDLVFAPPAPGTAAQPYEAAALRVRAAAARMLGRPQDALTLLESAAARVVPGHRAVLERAQIDVERGRALLDLARAAEAQAAFDAASKVQAAAASLAQPLFADAQVGLGRARLAQGDAAGALASLQAADAFWRDFDASNPWAAEALDTLARALRAAGQADAAAQAQARLARLVGAAPTGSHAVLDALRAAR